MEINLLVVINEGLELLLVCKQPLKLILWGIFGGEFFIITMTIKKKVFFKNQSFDTILEIPFD